MYVQRTYEMAEKITTFQLRLTPEEKALAKELAKDKGLPSARILFFISYMLVTLIATDTSLVTAVCAAASVATQRKRPE